MNEAAWTTIYNHISAACPDTECSGLAIPRGTYCVCVPSADQLFPDDLPRGPDVTWVNPWRVPHARHIDLLMGDPGGSMSKALFESGVHPYEMAIIAGARADM